MSNRPHAPGPAYSVVVPVHNARLWLRAAVESVLAQDFTEFELILVDDGSTDGGIGTVADVADPRLIVLSQPNAGAGPARNAGAAHARGGWIAFLDADDLWLPDHLAELDRIRRAFADAGLIGTAWASMRGAPPADVRTAGALREIDYLAAVGREGVPIRTSSIAIEAGLFASLGGFGAFPSGQDSELWVRAALAAPVAASSRVTCLYRTATGGITDRKRTGLRPPRALPDLSPAVATLMDAYPGLDPARRASADLFIARYLSWWIEAAAGRGDVETVRALGRLHRATPPPLDWLLMAAAGLPQPLARTAHRIALGGTRALRTLRR
jgi:glycosyltransferase involved in cell wall biosynthesis